MTEKLTLQDPISPEVLARFAEISSARTQMCEHYFDIDNEKVKLTVAIRQLDSERAKLFEKQLLDRGVSPNAPVEVDAKTGMITLRKEEPNE